MVPFIVPLVVRTFLSSQGLFIGVNRASETLNEPCTGSAESDDSSSRIVDKANMYCVGRKYPNQGPSKRPYSHEDSGPFELYLTVPEKFLLAALCNEWVQEIVEQIIFQLSYFVRHETSNFRNAVVFQVDDRLAGTISEDDTELNRTIMFTQNINRRIGLGNALYHYICTEKCHGMFVYWVKLVVFAILSELYPEYNVIHVDSDAVITEDLVQKVAFEQVSRPLIENISDLGGPHNAGFYMLYRHLFGTLSSVEKLPEKHECTAQVMSKYTSQQFKFTTSESHPLILDEQTSSFEQCIQSMMTCIWGSTTLDRVRIESIDAFFPRMVVCSWEVCAVALAK